MARSTEDDVRTWRIREAMRITGCSLKQARVFADGDGDLRRMEKLAEMIEKQGGDKLLALRIA